MLNLGGTLAALTRTESCGMTLSDSISLEQLKTEIAQGTFTLIPPEILLQHLVKITLSESDTKRWFQGQRIAQDLSLFTISDFVRVHEEAGRFLGIGSLVQHDSYQVLSPKIVL